MRDAVRCLRCTRSHTSCLNLTVDGFLKIDTVAAAKVAMEEAYSVVERESSCAALVVASISSFGLTHDFTAMCFPLLISSMGILVFLITTLFATDFFEIKAVKEIEPALKK